MFERLLTILSEYVMLDPQEIAPETELRTGLGMNSLEFIHLITVLEKEFQVEIPDREAINFQVVGDVVAYLEKESVAC
ncbi:MAG: acyl carrier protein [Bacillota bacterium]